MHPSEPQFVSSTAIGVRGSYVNREPELADSNDLLFGLVYSTMAVARLTLTFPELQRIRILIDAEPLPITVREGCSAVA
jgi:hypothetical protein